MRLILRGLRLLSAISAVGFVACTFETSQPSKPDGSTGAGLEAGPEASVEAGAESGPIPDPTNVDCSKPTNCYHLECYDDPNCQSTPDPGNCPVGFVNDLSMPDGAADGGPACRPCTADDCDGLSSFCCGADVCKNSVACGMYICAAIDATCNGVTSSTCGFHDLDGDDAWGDCDETPADPCCYCKIAVGCIDSKCGPGQFVKSGACATCTANDCMHPPCMGLNGCRTNCQVGFYFDGVRCRDCTSSSSQNLIPACSPDAGGLANDAGAD